MGGNRDRSAEAIPKLNNNGLMTIDGGCYKIFLKNIIFHQRTHSFFCSKKEIKKMKNEKKKEK